MLCVSGDLLLSTEELDQKLVSSLVTTVGKYCPPTPTHDAHKYVNMICSLQFDSCVEPADPHFILLGNDDLTFPVVCARYELCKCLHFLPEVIVHCIVRPEVTVHCVI